MNKNTIHLKAHYFTRKLKGNEYTYDIESKWVGRPAWIKITNSLKKLPRFLSIETPKYGEVIYKVFGHYYFPIDYTNDEERRFMDGVADEYDEMVGDKFNIPMAKALIEKIGVAQLSKDVHIMDLGCGTGILSRILADMGFFHFTLVDFSPNMLAKAKQRMKGVEDVKFECIDLRSSLPEDKFDIVVSVMLFNSFDEKTTEKIISDIHKQIKPAGLFVALEDKEKKAYARYFQMKFSGMVDIGSRRKYIFIGEKKI